MSDWHRRRFLAGIASSEFAGIGGTLAAAQRVQDDDLRTMGWAVAHRFDPEWLLATPLGEIASYVDRATPFGSLDIPAHVMRSLARMQSRRPEDQDRPACNRCGGWLDWCRGTCS